MEYIEITEKSLDEAITQACLKLGTTSDKIDYEVVEKGTTGLLGLFSKPTKIKARKLSDEEVEERKNAVKEEVKVEETPIVEETVKATTPAPTAKEEEKKVEKSTVDNVDKSVDNVVNNEKIADLSDKTETEISTATVMPKEVIESRIKNFLKDMFAAMDMDVNVEITFDDAEECVNVNLTGENMGALIGKRGQTLDSIQYLTSLVLNKGKDKYVRIKIDTENYRQRRKDTLENLAKNIAYKVKRSRRSVSLEPMNPYERRIIHSALQNDKFVSTKSEGEEPFRHVVVFLDREKEKNNKYNKYNK